MTIKGTLLLILLLNNYDIAAKATRSITKKMTKKIVIQLIALIARHQSHQQRILNMTKYPSK